MGTYWVNLVDDFTAKGFALLDGIANAAVHIHIQQDAAVAGNVIRHRDQAATVALTMLEHAETEPVGGFGRHPAAKYAPIESGGAVEVSDGNVEPDGSVVYTVLITHEGSSRVEGSGGELPMGGIAWD